MAVGRFKQIRVGNVDGFNLAPYIKGANPRGGDLVLGDSKIVLQRDSTWPIVGSRAEEHLAGEDFTINGDNDEVKNGSNDELVIGKVNANDAAADVDSENSEDSVAGNDNEDAAVAGDNSNDGDIVFFG